MSDSTAPLISIALCTYNGAQYLSKQLDSLLAQSCRDFEIVAIDDCSGDDTRAILQSYAQRDSRLRVFANARNIGFKRNFELAVAACRGRFIAPCDQDDIWLPDKLSSLLAAIGDKVMAYCDSELIDETDRSLGARISDYWFTPNIEDPAVFAFTNCVSGHAMLFRRELVERALPVPENFFHDWWLAAVAASSGGIAYCNRSLVRYRQHTGSVTDVLGLLGPGKSRRSPGYQLRRQREIGERIEQLCTLEGPHQEFLRELSLLWRARESQWISASLAWFMARHSQRLYALRRPRKSNLEILRRSVRFVWGLRLKRLANKYAYS